MADPIEGFGKTAQGLARNPLGIIALFIVLVYGFAALVTTFADSLSPSEKTPLIYFMVAFPVLVLAVFSWLVSKHSARLFAPSDFKSEENYVKLMSATASLTLASVKSDPEVQAPNIQEIVRTVRRAASTGDAQPRNKILWVDDNPGNNLYERDAFEAVGLNVTLARTTDEAVNFLSQQSFAAIISDMQRREGPREGYTLLDRLREGGNLTPLIFYGGSNSAQHREKAADHGGQGLTSSPQELFQLVIRAILH